MTDTADVAQAFPEECATGARKRQSGQRGIKPKHAPVVYFLREGEDGPIKIGKTTNMPARLTNIQAARDVHLRAIGFLDGGLSLETHLHQRFRHLWIKGEWFQNHPDIVAVATGKVPPFDNVTDELLRALKEMLGKYDTGDQLPDDHPIVAARAAVANAAGNVW